MAHIIPVFIPHAGCPHQCIFCNQRTISGQQENDLAAARRQIEKYQAWTKPNPENELAFYGGSFTALPYSFQEALLNLADEYRQSGLVGKLRLSTRPDYINPEEISLLESYGVKTVELGVQSLDDKVLVLAERGHTAACVEPAVRLLQASGFTVGLQLMVGLPGQDQSSLAATLQAVLKLKPEVVRIYPLLVIKGTPLAALYAAGKYEPLSLEAAVKATYYLYDALTQAGSRVIRMGLQPDEELCQPGNIIAGPFHPAFGEMVKSYGYYLSVQKVIDKLPVEGKYELVITYPARLASVVRGVKKENIKKWEKCGRIKVNLQIGDKFEVSVHDRKTL